ncbi:GntR family transcriptional regulator [Acuticoccus sediminis]|uniref:GntR family transcriptional regulator n=1 Tax=Acuticoccus sediminis TaxID=2184697 RepID=UPI001CFF1F0C|nr:GntR family transcriptional regulator [Acuticoccus sediminis]
MNAAGVDRVDVGEADVFDLDWNLGAAKQSLAERAYDRIEALFVDTSLPPGAFVRMQDLQTLVDLGRTPVHQAVRRAGSETLIRIRPRDGLTIAPVDLTRERRLADLRRSMDRFVVEEAAKRLSFNHRAGFMHLRRALVAIGEGIDIHTFNRFDRAFDTLLIAAAGEPFLQRTVRPLHAFARRIGYICIESLGRDAGIADTYERHLAILDAVVSGDVARATKASDALIDLSQSYVDDLSDGVDPMLLDVGLGRPADKRTAAQPASGFSSDEEHPNLSPRQTKEDTP